MFDYSWFKVGADTFNDPKIKIIEAEDDSDTIICIWFKSLCLARIVNDSGYLYINGETPYTLKTLAIEFNRPLDKVKAAIKVLRKLQMIELTEDKYYRVKNWTKYQNVDALEKQRAETSRRVAKHRAKKKLEKKNPDNNGENNSVPNEENNNGSADINKDDGNLQNDKESETKDVEVTIEDNENKHDNSSNNKSEINGNVTCNESNLQRNIESNSNVTKENIITENICNGSVTKNNVTVTDKIKRETKSQNKTEKKKESEGDNELSFKLSEQCSKITKHYESITGKIGCLDYGKLRLALSIHGEEYVRMAIDKAIEGGKIDFNYINGILKNWKREGYPSEKEEVKDSGGKHNNKGNTADKNEFAGFKPKKPKQLTEEQRKKIEADLI